MKKLLITYFEPFGGEAVNASMESVRLIPDTLGSWSLVRCRVPVVFGECAAPVLELLEKDCFDAVIMTGQAAGRKAVTPEFFAHNLRFARIPDNAGQTPLDEPVSDGPLALRTTADVRKMAGAIQDAGIPSQVSYSAGAYVCNDLYYQILCHNQKKSSPLPVCFIHVPSASDGFSYEKLSEALKAAILSL